MKSPFPAYWIFNNGRDHWTWKFADAGGEFVAMSCAPCLTQQDCLASIQAMRDTINLALFSTVDQLAEAAHTTATPAVLTPCEDVLDLTDEVVASRPGSGRDGDAVDQVASLLKVLAKAGQ